MNFGMFLKRMYELIWRPNTNLYYCFNKSFAKLKCRDGSQHDAKVLYCFNENTYLHMRNLVKKAFIPLSISWRFRAPVYEQRAQQLSSIVFVSYLNFKFIPLAI